MRWVLATSMAAAVGQAPALAAPISAEAPAAQSTATPQPWVPLSERELLSGTERADGLFEPGSPTLPQPDAFLLAERARRTGTDFSELGGLDSTRLFEPKDAFVGGSALDVLRGFVNIAPATGTASRANSRTTRASGVDSFAGIDLGPEAREWMQGAFKGIVDSVLELDVSAQGRISFSVLGLDEFGIAISGDRSQVALMSGDDVLLLAQRAPGSAGNAQGAGYSAGAGSPGSEGAAATSTNAASPFKMAIELVLEIASHPISVLVYLLVAAYALLWALLSRRTHRRKHRRSKRRSALRSDAVATHSHNGRRRHRIRRHRHA